MSSGESAKPTTQEERNPFDISRRSGQEVATEIAERLAAWKQARGRSRAASPAPPASPKPSGEARSPSITAPVQPARLPKQGEYADRAPMAGREDQPRPSGLPVPPRPDPVEDKFAGSMDTQALAAPATAFQRAMPPAPSPKPAPARGEPRIEQHPPTAADPASRTAEREPATVMRATDHESPVARSAPAEEAVPVEERAPVVAAEADEALAGTSAEVRDADRAMPPEADATATRQAEATDRPAEPVNRPAALSSDAPPAAQTPPRMAPAPGAEVASPDAGAPADEMALPRIDAQAAEMHEAELTAAGDASDRRADGAEPRRPPKPLFDLRAARQARAAAADTPPSADIGPERAAARPSEAMPDAARIARAESPDSERAHDVGRSFEALDREAFRIGRRDASDRAAGQPTGDSTPDAPSGAATAPPPGADRAAPEVRSDERPGRAGAEPSGARQIRIAAATPLRIEPREPPAGSPRTMLPNIETRIEARRFSSLRADPWIAGRRPMSAPTEPAPRVLRPPAAAARPVRPRMGTGWAIGLGTLMLIVGITAPAAIWQGRQAHPGDQDQVAALAPQTTSRQQPESESDAPARSSTEAQQSAPSTTQPTPAAQAQAPAGKPADAAAAPQQTAAAHDEPAPEKEAAEKAAERPTEQAALKPVGDGGELDDAPISSPPAPEEPAPVLHSASKPAAKAAAPAVPQPNRVAHAFVPEATRQPTPFHPQTAAIADVPVNGASVPIEGSPGAVTLKPSLIGQLKPQVAQKPASGSPPRAARKVQPQYPPTLDQMFQTLIDTLSSGSTRQTTGSVSKQIPPSSRR